MSRFGTLFIVATPIGNLQDLSFRAIEVLKGVDGIATEDTRHSGRLLQHFSISTPIISLHEHNEEQRIATLITRLQSGESLALISDAGTPLISDPGFHLVRAAHMAGIPVSPIPGACAAIAALSASGLPTDRFSFEGFLPIKNQARRERLEALREETQTLIFYEAPHRILEMVKALAEIFGPERSVVLARELTKMFETIHYTTLSELVEFLEKDANQQRGEIVLLVAGLQKKAAISDSNHVEAKRILDILLTELPVKQAAVLAAKISGGKKNELYELALTLKKNNFDTEK